MRSDCPNVRFLRKKKKEKDKNDDCLLTLITRYIYREMDERIPRESIYTDGRASGIARRSNRALGVIVDLIQPTQIKEKYYDYCYNY